MGSTGQAKKKALKCNDTSSSLFVCQAEHLKLCIFILNLTNIRILGYSFFVSMIKCYHLADMTGQSWPNVRESDL